MTLQEIDEMAITEPYCFENEQEEQWYKVGLREGADAAIEQLGWHPASEPPKEDGEYVVFCYGFDLPFKAKYSEYINEWSHRDVKWWCYPPKED